MDIFIIVHQKTVFEAAISPNVGFGLKKSTIIKNVNMEIKDNLEFEKLDREGVNTLVKWAKEEGWNPGPYDAEVYYATDPDGFYGYYHNGELIAGGAIISYGGKFGFMGLFIVRPDYRGYGIGRKLWYERRDKLLSRLDEGAGIGMDGVVDMQGFYRKGGFQTAFRDERYENRGKSYAIHPNIHPITGEDESVVLQYDNTCFGVPRPEFMKRWLFLPNNATFKYVEDAQLKGFAIVKEAARGYKISPLYADDAGVAEELYKACLQAAGVKPITIDIPLVNKEALQLVKKYKAEYIFECARMYYGHPPDMDIQKVFGITTFELG